MNPSPAEGLPRWSYFDKPALADLFEALLARGYEIVGPKIEQGAIVYAPLASIDELPRGWTEVQEAGTYRLQRRDDDYLFGYAVGPHSWKQFLFPPVSTLATAQRREDGWQFQPADEKPPRYAFLGVRGCDLAAIGVQDRIFLEGPCADPLYQRRRRDVLVVAVNCTQAAATCFCPSMNTGPRCRHGFDLALTELPEGFVVQVATVPGEEVLADVPHQPATPPQRAAADEAVQRTEQSITRRLDTRDIRNVLLGNLEHPRWDEVAGRCLSCTNCTMVCPTCFCSSVREVTDLTGDRVQRQRQWDSCFNIDFSYTTGGVVRNSIRSRYRQWLTHKLASWIDQFGVSGCVGCGRCIAWCPVGIDLTEEVPALRGAPP